MEFEIGQKAVFPAHGVGLIRAIRPGSYLGVDDDKSFYEIKILHDGSTIYQNVERALAEGMRKIIPEDAVERVLEVLRDRSTPCLLYTSPSPRDATLSRMPSSA